MIAAAIRNPFLTLSAALAVALAGFWSWRHVPVDALPDLSDNQVIVWAEWPGKSPQDMDQQVTSRLARELQGLPGVQTVRGMSLYGVSYLYVIFEERRDLYECRTRVLERLSQLTGLLPPGVNARLGPDATAMGQVFAFTLQGPRDLESKRYLLDHIVVPALRAVPGVAEVAPAGGVVREYQIDVEPTRLEEQGLTLDMLMMAVQSAGRDVGVMSVEQSGVETMIRGAGFIRSVADVENIILRGNRALGAGLRLGDIATVTLGGQFRQGLLADGFQEHVGAIIGLRVREDPQTVINAVKRSLASLAPTFAREQITVVPFYDRSSLIRETTATLSATLVEAVVTTAFVVIAFLLHVRASLAVAISLPLGMLFTFLVMRLAGVGANIMSLAGIAIAIGVLVDAGIVVTENAFRQMERTGIDVRDRRAVWTAVLQSTRLVGRPVFFSMTIIVLAFVPVFALTGQAGKLFQPLAFAKTFAVLAATLLAVTLVPVLCTFLLGGKLHDEGSNPVMRVLRRLYEPVLRAALAHRYATIGAAALVLAGALIVGSRIGSEFMPPLNEGDLLFMPIADPSVSLEQNTDIARRQNVALMSVPEVEYAVAKVGRADTSTDPSPLNMTETIVHLKPREEWRAGMTLDRLRAELSEAAALPGVTNIWTMPIINRIDMLSTGVRSEIGVKIYGSDLTVLDQTARRVAEVLRGVRGAANVYPEPLMGAQYLNIRVNREAAARYGLNVAAVQDVIATAVGEQVVTQTLEGRRRFPVRVRYAGQYRDESQTLENVLVAAPSGEQVPLGQVATFEQTRGAAMITSENGLLLATVLLNVQGRDVGGFIDEARAAVASQVALPQGYFVGWSGRYENQELARQRLQVIVPIVLVVIFALLYFIYHSALEAAHVMLAVPFALTGGVYLLWLLGYNFSVAVWVGFIALFGTAVQTGIVMVIYLDEAVRKKMADVGGALTRRDLREAVIEGALLRLRPKLMTVSTVVAGLLPIMWSERVGAEVMKPLATPVLGGMLSSLIHVLVVTPVLFYWIHERRAADAAGPHLDTSNEYVGRVPLREDASGPAVWKVVAVLVLATVLGAGWWLWNRNPTTEPAGVVIETVRSGEMTITLSNPGGRLPLGAAAFRIEFRSTETTDLVDVGTVRLAALMPMPGMPMSGGVTVTPTGQAGVYEATGNFGMAGAWQMTIEWNGPAGRGSAALEGNVQ